MNTFTLDTIRATFQQHGYHLTTQIQRKDFALFMKDLVKGNYDDDIEQQLWEETAKGAFQVRVDDICATIYRGHQILRNKINQIQEQIRRFQTERQQMLRAGHARNAPQVISLQNQIQILREELSGCKNDLQVLDQPFKRSSHRKQNSHRESNNYYQHSQDQMEEEAAPNEHQQLKWALWLTVIFGCIQLIIIYGKYDFLNLLVVACLLSVFFLNHFDQISIRITLGLLLMSLVMDIIWLILEAEFKWSNVEGSSRTTNYNRFIVFFTILLCLLKCPLCIFLYKYWNSSPDSTYKIDAGFMKIILDANKNNPVSQGFKKSIAQYGYQ